MTTPSTCPTCGHHLYDMDSPGAVGRDHPETSRRAATLPKFGSQRWNVLSWLGNFGPSTAARIAPLMDLSRNQAAARLWELRNAGLVDYVRDEQGEPRTIPVGPKTRGRVHDITPAGERLLAPGARRAAAAEDTDER